MCFLSFFFFFFFFNDTATTEIYTLSLHDALPIYRRHRGQQRHIIYGPIQPRRNGRAFDPRSEEHTSELQSQSNLVCRLLLEKKKKKKKRNKNSTKIKHKKLVSHPMLRKHHDV